MKILGIIVCKCVLFSCTSLLMLMFASCQLHKEFSVMTLNVRRDVKSDKQNKWVHRRALMEGFLNEYKPDIACFQEVLKSQMNDLTAYLPDFIWVGCGRDDGNEKGEYNPIFFRKKRYDCVKHGTLWLSESPHSVGSVGWDASSPRIATWAVLFDKVAKAKIIIINTHIDHKGEVAKLKSIKLINDSLVNKFSLPVVLTGDFNSQPHSDPYNEVMSGKNLKDVFPSAKIKEGADYTYHNFGNRRMRRRIDYVFVSSDLAADKISIIKDIKAEETYLSDHNPVISLLRFSNK